MIKFITKNKNKLKQEKGFTLVELGIVLIISGFVMVASAQIVKLYTTNMQYDKTLENLKVAMDALNEYKGYNGVYPCPADPTLGPNDSNYGKSICRSVTDLQNNQDNCTDSGASLGGITCIQGAGVLARDGDENGADDVIMIGVIPFRTLFDFLLDKPEGAGGTPFREHHKMDGYNMLLSYAVTEHMTDETRHSLVNPANPWTGAITVIDENKLDVTTPPKSAHYVIYSHGEDKKGAYSPEGRRFENCNVPQIVIDGGGSAIPSVGIGGASNAGEIENCDNNDAAFLQGIRMMADGGKYNDDLLYYKGMDFLPIWERLLSSPNGKNYIHNTNLGSVAIGTETPDGGNTKLHVIGNISAEDFTTTTEYCDGIDASTCLDPDKLGGSGSFCHDGLGNPVYNQVAYAIQDNEIVCRPIDWSAALDKNCGIHPAIAPDPGAGEQTFIRGISNLGGLYCCTQHGNNCYIP